MATYYVDPVHGNDANNGLGPNAAHATNKPWKTLGKLLGSSGMASGDTAYLSPSGQFRETVTVNMTSPTAETKIIGDPANAQGFRDSAGNLVSAGPVIVSAWTNDKSNPSSSALINLNAKSHLTFENIFFLYGDGGGFSSAATPSNFRLRNCSFWGSGGAVSITIGFGVNSGILIERCRFFKGYVNTLAFTLTRGSGSDYDANVSIRDCFFIGGRGHAVSVGSTGTGANLGGGVVVRNITNIGAGTMMSTTGSISTSIPCRIYNSLCWIQSTVVALDAAASGHIVEDWNFLVAEGGARTNVTAGANSVTTNYSPMIHFGQELMWGGVPRVFGEPMLGSPFLGFGSDGSATANDQLNRPRPAGGKSALPAVGSLERGNSWSRETTVVRSGTNSLSITGPGYQDFDIPVNPQPTTVSVYMRYDSTYTGTKPRFQILNGEECGVSPQTSSAVSTANTWEQLSLSFTPTRAGIVTMRLLSSDTNGNGKAFADDISVV